MIFLQILHWVAGIITLAEALNKLERTTFTWLGLTGRARLALVVKTAAWLGLAIGGGCAVVSPLVSMDNSRWQDMCLLIGFALLITRTRMKESD